jgi:hypothetical protein
MWNIAEAKQVSTRKLKAFAAYCVTFTPDGKHLVTGHHDNNCYVNPVTP